MKRFFKLAPLSVVLTLLALLAGCPDSTLPSPIIPKVPQPTTPKVPQPKAQTGDAHSRASDASGTPAPGVR